MTVEEALKDKKPFEAWLRGKKPRGYAGVPGNSLACPVACFIRQEVGFASVAVSNFGIAVSHRDTIDTPLWVSRFIMAADNLTGHRRVITAQRALKILEAV